MVAGLWHGQQKRRDEAADDLFLRIQPKIDVTGTFKQKKVDLVREGFNPATIKDPIYFNDPAAKAFVRLDAALYARIDSGDIRL